jgi:hypothetical protein
VFVSRDIVASEKETWCGCADVIPRHRVTISLYMAQTLYLAASQVLRDVATRSEQGPSGQLNYVWH